MRTGAEQLNWRVLARMDAERRGETLEAAYTAADDRSYSQEQLLNEASGAKKDRRLANLAVAHGRVHTSNGVTYFNAGRGTPRNR